MTDTPATPGKEPASKSKIICSVLAGIVANYFMNYASLRGVNFETFGIPSEMIKSALVGAWAGFFAWVTPNNVRSAARDALIWLWETRKILKKAAEEGKE